MTDRHSRSRSTHSKLPAQRVDSWALTWAGALTIDQPGGCKLCAGRHQALGKVHMVVDCVGSQACHLQLVQGCTQSLPSSAVLVWGFRTTAHRVTAAVVHATPCLTCKVKASGCQGTQDADSRLGPSPRRSTCLTGFFRRGALLPAVSCDSCQSRRSRHRVTYTRLALKG